MEELAAVSPVNLSIQPYLEWIIAAVGHKFKPIVLYIDFLSCWRICALHGIIALDPHLMLRTQCLSIHTYPSVDINLCPFFTQISHTIMIYPCHINLLLSVLEAPKLERVTQSI